MCQKNNNGWHRIGGPVALSDKSGPWPNWLPAAAVNT